MTGQRYGRLTCIEYAGTDDNGMARWRVRCDCGTEFIAYRVNIKSGATRSCGCIKREKLIAYNKSRSKSSGAFEIRENY